MRAPSYSSALDYELELGMVPAAPLPCHPDEAVAADAFVLVNDFSARDVQRAEMASGPQKSKHFANSMSATAVTPDEVLTLHRRADGKRRHQREDRHTVSSGPVVERRRDAGTRRNGATGPGGCWPPAPGPVAAAGDSNWVSPGDT